jgi:hypothetical protein
VALFDNDVAVRCRLGQVVEIVGWNLIDSRGCWIKHLSKHLRSIFEFEPQLTSAVGLLFGFKGQYLVI